MPRCGRHREQGFSVTVRQSSIPAQTQFGEWPAMCALFKRNLVTDINEFVGGASLIAKGVAMTVAHLVK